MSTLWVGREHMDIRKYSVTGTNARSVVKIEIEITDPIELGFFLKELEEAKRTIDNARKAKADDERAAKRRPKPKAIEQTKLLALPFYGGYRP